MSLTNPRVQLLRDAADDCESEANNLLNQAPNMGPTKERNYRNEAAGCLQRASELRAWAKELEQVEPSAEHPIEACMKTVARALDRCVYCADYRKHAKVCGNCGLDFTENRPPEPDDDGCTGVDGTCPIHALHGFFADDK